MRKHRETLESFSWMIFFKHTCTNIVVLHITLMGTSQFNWHCRCFQCSAHFPVFVPSQKWKYFHWGGFFFQLWFGLFCQSRLHLLDSLIISLQAIFLKIIEIAETHLYQLPKGFSTMWLSDYRVTRLKALLAFCTMCPNLLLRAVWDWSVRWLSPLEISVPTAEGGSHGKHPFSHSPLPPSTTTFSSCRSSTETLLCRTKRRPADPTMKSDGRGGNRHEESSDESATHIICRPGRLSEGHNSTGYIVPTVAAINRRQQDF